MPTKKHNSVLEKLHRGAREHLAILKRTAGRRGLRIELDAGGINILYIDAKTGRVTATRPASDLV